MPQRDLLLPWYSAIDNAALALRNRGLRKAEARARAGELFARFGLAGFEAGAPAELSGGMRQRVAFLRTLVAGKPLLALDEPFASLDAITRAEMQEWLAEALGADPRTVVFVTHDVEEALYLSDRVAVLSARPARIVAELQAPEPRAPNRDAAVTDPAFVAVREQAMRALHEGIAMRRWLLPTLLLAALIGGWQIAASTGTLADVLGLDDVPRPLSRRNRPLPLGGPLAARRQRLGDSAGDSSRPRLRSRRRSRLRGADAPFEDGSRCRLPADRRLADDPDHRHLARSCWSGSASASVRRSSIVALICFFPITVNALDGLRSVEPDAIKLMRTLDASRWQVFRRVEAPTALP